MKNVVLKIISVISVLFAIGLELIFLIVSIWGSLACLADYRMNRELVVILSGTALLILCHFLIGLLLSGILVPIGRRALMAGWILWMLCIVVQFGLLFEDANIVPYCYMGLWSYSAIYSAVLFQREKSNRRLMAGILSIALLYVLFPVLIDSRIFDIDSDYIFMYKVLLGQLTIAAFSGVVLRLVLRKFSGHDKERRVKLLWRAKITGVSAIAAFSLLIAVSRFAGSDIPMPRQDEDGYYLLRSRDGFNWFINEVRDGNKEINVRLDANIILNDVSDRENWDNVPPRNDYRCMLYYNGCFDGNGFAIVGYYSGQETPIFLYLEEQARVTDLRIEKSVFQTTYEESFYLDDNNEINVVPASSLCYVNYGHIENCDVEADVLGAWSAGGIAAMNYGEIKGCRFSGNVESGRYFCDDRGDDRWAVGTIYTGGICRSDRGNIIDCINEGSITALSISSEYSMNYAAGGIAGTVSDEGSIADSQNTGTVVCAQLAGGIAGASTGEILNCSNRGAVHVEQADLSYTTSLITAGICASNGGLVKSCFNAGNITIRQEWLSFFAPVYGIACNIVNPKKGCTENCYYLSDSAVQDYRQSGVYKLSSEEIVSVEDFHPEEHGIKDIDTWELLTSMPDYPGTDENDYIHMYLGPEREYDYTVEQGDSLWSIAAAFYGDGNCYTYLEREENSEDEYIYPGEHIKVKGQEYYLLHVNDEEGFDTAYCELASGEKCPTRFFASKPADWYYGYVHFPASSGWNVMWPKKERGERDEPAADIRIFYRIDANPQGDFFADEWENVKESMEKSAEMYCGQAMDGLRFYRYGLDGGEALYGLSFRLYREDGNWNCAAFYRVRDGFLAEYVGMEPEDEDWNVLERTRYLAARVEDGPAIREQEYTGEEFYGRDGWDFTLLHNPFATVMEYDADAECSSYMLFTGAQ